MPDAHMSHGISHTTSNIQIGSNCLNQHNWGPFVQKDAVPSLEFLPTALEQTHEEKTWENEHPCCLVATEFHEPCVSLALDESARTVFYHMHCTSMKMDNSVQLPTRQHSRLHFRSYESEPIHWFG